MRTTSQIINSRKSPRCKIITAKHNPILAQVLLRLPEEINVTQIAETYMRLRVGKRSVDVWKDLSGKMAFMVIGDRYYRNDLDRVFEIIGKYKNAA